LNIRNKKDFGAGIMYMVFGLFFALNALNYKMGTAAKMGPGYFPFWLGALLLPWGFLFFSSPYPLRLMRSRLASGIGGS